jgi:4-phospho-D-threonate 3-dehydrogenase / 4-phospho-D-erythronate 3-dehydrogenase
MGDPAGIGPEVVVKALSHPEISTACRPIVVGDVRRLKLAAQVCGVDCNVIAIPEAGIENGDDGTGAILVLDVGLAPDDLPWGQVSPAAGQAAYRYVERAAELALDGRVQGICTAPLNKEALHAAGHPYPGHTELLADLTHTAEVSMMLEAPGLRVVHVTTHIGILDAIERIEPGLVARTIRRAHETLVRTGIEHPRIAVCGINPHAGEHGLFGRGEEATKIDPAIAEVHRDGIDAVGPLPADTLFFRARRGDFDCVVAMYHDQGHGPVKVLGLEAGVNITIGLPVVRTSVDHGTAFDIAGTGAADERSMVAAIEQAVALATVALR